jgi:hypothetical protein
MSGATMNRDAKRVAIVQSNYIPWKGYFDLIAASDEFILYDDAQYTRRDWRNRNQIKTPQGVQWLSVPVKVKGKYHQSIRETEIDGADWAPLHWKALQQNYARAPHFARYADELEALYTGRTYGMLSELNVAMLTWVLRQLEIGTRVSSTSDCAARRPHREAAEPVRAGGRDRVPVRPGRAQLPRREPVRRRRRRGALVRLSDLPRVSAAVGRLRPRRDGAGRAVQLRSRSAPVRADLERLKRCP